MMWSVLSVKVAMSSNMTVRFLSPKEVICLHFALLEPTERLWQVNTTVELCPWATRQKT